MQQMTCPNLVTVVNALYINDVDGANPRLFNPQDQYTYTEKLIPAPEMTTTECEPKCAYGLYMQSLGPIDIADGPEDYGLKLIPMILNFCTGELQSVSGTVTIMRDGG